MKLKEQILNRLHSRFEDNRNQQKRIFVPFLIALLVVFGAFGYIYTHTHSTMPATQTVVGNFYDVPVYSYGVLLVTSAVVLGILTFLIAITLNLGYSLRRDQYLSKQISFKHLGKNDYQRLFGDLCNPEEKKICNFLPDFHKIFFWFILASQIVVLLLTFCKEYILQIGNQYFTWSILSLNILLILISIILYFTTFSKYKKNIKNAEKRPARGNVKKRTNQNSQTSQTSQTAQNTQTNQTNQTNPTNQANQTNRNTRNRGNRTNRGNRQNRNTQNSTTNQQTTNTP
jgi:hypothetical protein